MEVNKNIPVVFQKLESVDDRYTKVKIWLMHTGQNLNKSYFEKSIVEKAIPTLANNPILGFIEENGKGEDDFSDHRNVVSKEGNTWKIKYNGSAYGVIPENNNAKFEMKMCDDGVEREFLTCEGLMWNKWDDPVDIMNRDLTKSQSMELHNDYEGSFDKQGVFHFTKFSFFGACILGNEVKPAMVNATIEVNFSNDIANQIAEKLEEYKRLVAQKFASNTDNTDIENHRTTDHTEGGSKVDEKKLELLAKYSVTQEQLQDAGINVEEFSLEDLDAKIQEFKASNSTDDKTNEGKENESNDKFSLSGSQLAQELNVRLKEDGGSTKDDWGYEMRNYYYVDHKDSVVVAESRLENWSYVGFDYSMNGDFPVINFESKRRYKLDWAPMEGSEAITQFGLISKERAEYDVAVAKKTVESEIENIKSEFGAKVSTLEQENNELKIFKKTVLTEKRKVDIDEAFAKFTQLSEQDISEFKTECYESEISIQEIEDKLFSMVGRKYASNFSTSQPESTKNTNVKIGLTEDDQGTKNEKEYVHILHRFSKK